MKHNSKIFSLIILAIIIFSISCSVRKPTELNHELAQKFKILFPWIKEAEVISSHYVSLFLSDEQLSEALIFFNHPKDTSMILLSSTDSENTITISDSMKNSIVIIDSNFDGNFDSLIIKQNIDGEELFLKDLDIKDGIELKKVSLQ